MCLVFITLCLIDGQRGFGSYVKLDAPINTLPETQKKAKIKEFYSRMLNEARSYGLNEEQVLAFITRKKTL